MEDMKQGSPKLVGWGWKPTYGLGTLDFGKPLSLSLMDSPSVGGGRVTTKAILPSSKHTGHPKGNKVQRTGGHLVYTKI